MERLESLKSLPSKIFGTNVFGEVFNGVLQLETVCCLQSLLSILTMTRSSIPLHKLSENVACSLFTVHFLLNAMCVKC